MALLHPGVLGKVSGRVGGVEVAQVGGLSVLKQRKTRASSPSLPKMHAQAIAAAQLRRWRALTDDQRRAWDQGGTWRYNLDRFGNKRYLTGLQLFQMTQSDFRYAGPPTYPTVPPKSRSFFSAFPITATLSMHAPVDVELELSVPYSSLYAWLMVSRFRATGRRAYTWRKVGMVNDEPPNLHDFHLALIGEGISFVVGEQVYVKIGIWHPDYVAWEFDYGLHTVEAP